MVLAGFAVGMVAILCGFGGDDTSRISVSGTILLDGKPLESGTIRFILTSPSDNIHVDVSVVEEGSYSIPQSESLIPGEYKIEIRSAAQEVDSTAFMSDANQIPPDHQFRVAEKYSTQSKLGVKIEHRGLSRFDFDLPNH
jgi:hypothetical protein